MSSFSSEHHKLMLGALCYGIQRKAGHVECWCSRAVATRSSTDGWPFRAGSTENRCVSCEDEGLTDKHYWRTSATCHNTGHIGAAPCIHQLHHCLWGGGCSSISWRTRSPITHPRILDAGSMLGPGTCLPLLDHSHLHTIEEKTLRCTWEISPR